MTVTSKLPKPLRRQTAREIATTYSAWPVHRPDVEDIVSASQLEERQQLSFWDAVIVVSALRAGAKELVTEDLQDGRRFDGLLVVNPFGTGADVERSTGLE